jgi:hypothetical protein
MRMKQVGKIGTIRREVLGKACNSCGGRTYEITFHAGQMNIDALLARCTHCKHPRTLGQDLGRILWM